MGKFTVILTKKENKNTNFQIKGWHTEKSMEKLNNKYFPENTFIDYVQGFQGDKVSCPIHKKITK